MRETDVLIAGGGFAGSLCAAMLGRAGIGTIVVDPHTAYPPDFRCEKLDGIQMRTLALTGLADAVVRASTLDRECWLARFGRVLEKRPGDQHGILYDTLVNTVRAQIPSGTEFIHAKVMEIATSADRQTVTMSNGVEISARLVVLATGLNAGLRHKLGIEREIISPAHSISIGFDVQPADRQAFPFPALTYYSEHSPDTLPYITLFPIGATMRANLFAYRELNDPWLKQFRSAPRETLYGVWPRLRELMGEFTVPGFVQIRPVDLYVTKGYRQAGVVLVGDAFATSCPAAGTGARKALVDVERLGNVHIPRWLATPGMDAAKISSFYDDPVKRACDAFSLGKAFHLRSYTCDPAPSWAFRRWAKFILHKGRGLLRGLTAAEETGGGEETESVATKWAPGHPGRK